MEKATETLNTLGKTNTVEVKWIKAHVGLLGNEKADCAAKAGTTASEYGDYIHVSKQELKTRITSKAKEIWEQRWVNKADCAQSRKFIAQVNPKLSADLLSLDRETLGRIVRFTTGHAFLRRHNFLLDQGEDEECRLCLEDDETASHIILECPALAQRRRDIFGIIASEKITDWTVKEMVSFLDCSAIKALETDDLYGENIL